jgi:glyoxylase-like metal-dependent hydrolase (beta-lactamase superfamily II)
MTKKQEQEPARTEISEVAKGVLRMELPIRMPGLGHVNMYALLDDRGAAVVDPGLPGPATWRAIRQRLQQAGLEVRHVHTVVVTHSHPDHFGGAARFAREAGAEVVAHRSFRFGVIESSADPEVSVDDLAAQADADVAPATEDAATHRAVIQRWDHQTPWGGQHPRPGLRTRLKWHAARLLGRSFIPAVSRPVRQGDVIRLAGREWHVTHTPGHTEDHICLHDPDEGIFLAGDHVLPTITPHISGLSLSKDPLDNFFASLDRVGAIPGVRLCLPAHGHPFSDLRARTEAIKRHHYERLEKVKAIGRDIGPASVQAFSERLFKPRSWGGMAESETFAHLEHLRHGGEATCRRDAAGLLIYETG